MKRKWYCLIYTNILARNVQAMAVFPFILIKKKTILSKVILNHEQIHLRQQLEMLIVPFYVLYLIEYLVRFIQLKNHDRAYRSISFEREAYANDRNLDYLIDRKFWAWIRYL